MNLQYPLSKTVLHALALSNEESLCYSVPYDIDEQSNFTSNCYLVVTNKRLLVTKNDQILKEYQLSDISDIKNEPYIGSGALLVCIHEEYELVVRYSAHHLSRYSYIARGCRLLLKGEFIQVTSSEYETFCPKCGRALPRTKDCPHCNRLGEGFFHELSSMLSPYHKQLFVIFIFMLLAAAVTMLNPEVQKHLVDDVLTGQKGTYGEAMSLLIVLFLLSFGIVVINLIKNYLCSKLGSTISMDLRKKLYHKIQILSLSFIHDRRPGELMNRVIYDTARVREFMQDNFCNLFTVLIIFICDIVYMLILDWKLALLSFVFMPFTVIITAAFWSNIHRRFHRQWKKNDTIHSDLQDVISGMNVVKSYGKEQEASEHFNKITDDFTRTQRRNETFWAIFFPSIQFLLGAGVYLVTFFGGAGVLSGDKTVGELIQFVNYTSMLYMYLGWLTNLPRRLMDLVNSVERINEINLQEPSIHDTKQSVNHEIQGNIEFKKASFGYKSYEPVLENINLSVKQGEMIGLVGASGTGKSTMINLIMHLYEVDDGELLIDGINIKDIKLANYHSQIGVVLQETFLFSGTILNNLRFAKPDATYEEIIHAAKMANAHDFICKTPDGYNTYVGEKGFNLSGGERQRIAIARAILSDPKILILDEATASLDTESEYLIQKALSRLTKGRTTFAIAHRLSTLKDANRLVVIDGHSIAEIGTHNELMNQKGIYHRLVNAQLKMQET